MEYTIKPIAYMHSDYKTKFGIPRQAGIVDAVESRIVFEPEYRSREALRGIEDYSHLWLIWRFSAAEREDWSPTVRPPRLGGNVRMGVFATRSPFRPNSLGLSCVRLVAVEEAGENGLVLRVAGADLMDGTPIFDIKPYVPYADSHPDANPGIAPDSGKTLPVEYSAAARAAVPEEKLAGLTGVLANDPRPRYQQDGQRVYALEFADMEIKFSVENGVVKVLSADKSKNQEERK